MNPFFPLAMNIVAKFSSFHLSNFTRLAFLLTFVGHKVLSTMKMTKKTIYARRENFFMLFKWLAYIFHDENGRETTPAFSLCVSVYSEIYTFFSYWILLRLFSFIPASQPHYFTIIIFSSIFGFHLLFVRKFLMKNGKCI